MNRFPELKDYREHEDQFYFKIRNLYFFNKSIDVVDHSLYYYYNREISI